MTVKRLVLQKDNLDTSHHFQSQNLEQTLPLCYLTTPKPETKISTIEHICNGHSIAV